MASVKKTAPKAAAAPAAPAQAVAEEIATNVNEAMQAVVEQSSGFQETVQRGVDQGLEQGRVAFDKMKGAADEASSSLEKSYNAASKGVAEFNAKALAAVQANTAAMMEMVHAMSGVTSVSEAVQIQTDHARKQYEAMLAQVKELSELAQKVAHATAEPIKASFTKGLSSFR